MIDVLALLKSEYASAALCITAVLAMWPVLIRHINARIKYLENECTLLHAETRDLRKALFLCETKHQKTLSAIIDMQQKITLMGEATCAKSNTCIDFKHLSKGEA